MKIKSAPLRSVINQVQNRTLPLSAKTASAIAENVAADGKVQDVELAQLQKINPDALATDAFGKAIYKELLGSAADALAQNRATQRAPGWFDRALEAVGAKTPEPADYAPFSGVDTWDLKNVMRDSHKAELTEMASKFGAIYFEPSTGALVKSDVCEKYDQLVLGRGLEGDDPLAPVRNYLFAHYSDSPYTPKQRDALLKEHRPKFEQVASALGAEVNKRYGNTFEAILLAFDGDIQDDPVGATRELIISDRMEAIADSQGSWPLKISPLWKSVNKTFEEFGDRKGIRALGGENRRTGEDIPKVTDKAIRALAGDLAEACRRAMATSSDDAWVPNWSDEKLLQQPGVKAAMVKFRAALAALPAAN